MIIVAKIFAVHNTVVIILKNHIKREREKKVKKIEIYINMKTLKKREWQ